MNIFIVCAICVCVVSADVSHIVVQEEVTTTTEYYPPRPYAFSYEAGRYPNHVDRTHSEVGDGAGTVRGSFSYVDPRNQVRTVEYVADENGFQPQLSHEVKNTIAVDLATKRHTELYNKIAASHANPIAYDASAAPVPQDSVAVANAKKKHLTLFEKIAAEHARIGEEQLQQRLAFEATSVPNEHDVEHGAEHNF
ncbi:unnamed protein product [Diamesa hyperborea]